MTKYILTGPHPLEFSDLRVMPSPEGTPFEYDLDAAREASLAHVLRRADVEPPVVSEASTRAGRARGGR